MTNQRNIIQDVGMRVFIDYYWLFKDTNLSNKEAAEKINENYTDKSKLSRVSKARRIIRENKHLETLEMILKSNSRLVYEDTKVKAKEIYNIRI